MNKELTPLEKLDRLFNFTCNNCSEGTCAKGCNKDCVYFNYWKGIEKTLKEKEKQYKILKILKEKKIDVYAILTTKSLDEYNKWYVWFQDEFLPLTQAEYDLLKEVLL